MKRGETIIKLIVNLFTVASCLAFATAPLHAAQSEPAANYPSKPIRFIVPFSPGAGTDLTARTLAQKLNEKWGQQVVADNRTGALEKDLQGITQATSLFYVLYIHPSIPAKSVAELITYAKANPGKLNFGSSGNNTLQHFAGEMLNHLAGIKIIHIPYKGTAAVIPAMMAGEVQVGYGSLIGTRPQMQAGRLRGIAITAAKRSPSIDLPTVAESGVPGYEVDQWYGVITSARVPQSIVKKLSDAMIEGLQQPETAARLAGDGSIPVGSSPAQFTAHIKSEIAKWKRLVKEANLKMEK
ncbi:MAG: hypothetical protein K8S22_04510 [Betaproteobacteria bacterium]|nr:hypothetical protein [Betaproteobacteria bacterium]